MLKDVRLWPWADNLHLMAPEWASVLQLTSSFSQKLNEMGME